jgi:glycosyltransferase involved in cell wall biosynthesis
MYESIYSRFRDAEDIVLIRKYLDRKRFFAYIRMLDLAVFPYREDIGHIGISGALHAAMGSFIPILCTQVPRLIECYTGTPDLTVSPESPRLLAEKISWAIDEYDEALIVSEKLWSYGIDTMWQNVARRHIDLYESL